MIEKTDLKKVQQKNKKVKQEGKGNKNGIKPRNKPAQNNAPNPGNNKKKVKGNKPQNNNNVNKNLKKKKGSEGKSFLWVSMTVLFYITLVPTIIYIVDYEKFCKIKNFASYFLSKAISFLPASVVAQGQVAAEYIRPVTDDVVNKLSIFINGISTFLNTNPFVKEHWANIRDISSTCGACLVDYLRTLYQQITRNCLDFKNKFF